MTIRDCIVKAAGLLGLKELAARLAGDTQTAEEAGEYLGLSRDVIAEVCSDFYPLKTLERVAAVDGVVRLNNLSKPVIDVFAVKRNGVGIPFVIKFDRLEVTGSGEVEVEYSFMPDLSGLDVELPFSGRIDARVIGFGIAAEYAILHRPAEAEMFDTRYKNALKKAAAVKNERRVRGRVWA